MGGGLWHFSVSSRPYWFFDLIGTWLGLGLGGLGTKGKGLGTGLDNSKTLSPSVDDVSLQTVTVEFIIYSNKSQSKHLRL